MAEKRPCDYENDRSLTIIISRRAAVVVNNKKGFD